MYLAGAPTQRVWGGMIGSFGDQCPGADQRPFSDHHLVHDHGLHADESAVFHGAAVEGDAVADGDVVADDERRAGVFGVFLVGDMQHGEVLDVAPVADADEVHVAACHDVIPDAALRADLHVADDNGGFGDKGAGDRFSGESPGTERIMM